jgi:phage-related protein
LVTVAINVVVSEIQALAAAVGAVLDPIFQVIIDGLETALELALGLIEAAVDAVASVVQLVVDELLTLAAGIWDAFVTAVSDIIQAVLDVLSLIITELMAIASTFLDGLLDLLPFGIGDFLRGFNNLSISTVTQQLFDMIDWVLTFSLIWLMLFLGAYMFVFPIMQNRDNPGAVFGDMVTNAFSLHGFDFTTALGNVTIPIRVNAFAVWLGIVILLGYLSWILPYALF